MNAYISDYTKKETSRNVRHLTLINGLSYPTDEELILLILGKKVKSADDESTALKVLEVIASGGESTIERLTEIEGVGEAKAIAIAAAVELGKRMRGALRVHIEEPSDVVPYLKHYALLPTEHFITVNLNGAHEIISTNTISMGTTDRALIHPREVFAASVSEHASGIICCHNHPAGKCYPSEADITSTRVLVSAAKILGISFLDHIILTSASYYSFLEHNMLDA